jgi:hypothetical protein
MKTKVEIEGYEIEIVFTNGVISVKAEKDEEVVEEFTIEVEGQDSQEDSDEDDEIQGFGDFSEEDDFEGQGQDDDDDEDEDDDDAQDDMPALESFQSFSNRKK